MSGIWRAPVSSNPTDLGTANTSSSSFTIPRADA
jgi:hypothetical protein